MAPDVAPAAAESGPGQIPGRSTFAEPWQARAFALAVLVSGQGCFTWSEWSHALSRELRHSSRIDPDTPEAGYFECWLAALQSLLIGKGAVGQAELSERREAWADAYRRTPHGVPVSLSAP